MSMSIINFQLFYFPLRNIISTNNRSNTLTCIVSCTYHKSDQIIFSHTRTQNASQSLSWDHIFTQWRQFKLDLASQFILQTQMYIYVGTVHSQRYLCVKSICILVLFMLHVMQTFLYITYSKPAKITLQVYTDFCHL